MARQRKVQPLRTCAPETDCTPVVAGNKADGRRSVAVWLTSSAVSMYIASDRLRSSPLVHSLLVALCRQVFHHFGTSCLVCLCVKSNFGEGKKCESRDHETSYFGAVSTRFNVSKNRQSIVVGLSAFWRETLLTLTEPERKGK